MIPARYVPTCCRRAIQVIVGLLMLCAPELASAQGRLGPSGDGCFSAAINNKTVSVALASCQDLDFLESLRVQAAASDLYYLLGGDGICVAEVHGKVAPVNCHSNSAASWSISRGSEPNIISIRDADGQRCLTRAGDGTLYLAGGCTGSEDQSWIVGKH